MERIAASTFQAISDYTPCHLGPPLHGRKRLNPNPWVGGDIAVPTGPFNEEPFTAAKGRAATVVAAKQALDHGSNFPRICAGHHSAKDVFRPSSSTSKRHLATPSNGRMIAVCWAAPSANVRMGYVNVEIRKCAKMLVTT
jgi:hypothetical protein